MTSKERENPRISSSKKPRIRNQELRNSTSSKLDNRVTKAEKVYETHSKTGKLKSSSDTISVRGARVHNLQDVDLDIPKDSLVVFCGVSGSGKSSIAFDTIFAEGQRRYVESLSSYARQFLGQVDKPDVDRIDGLSPAVSIDQKTTSHNPRSTVGTVTEIWDHLRLLFSRAGTAHCSKCSSPLTVSNPGDVTDQVIDRFSQDLVTVISPIVRDRKGTFEQTWDDLAKKGFTRVRVDGEMYRLGEVPVLSKNKSHRIDIVIDRMTVENKRRNRLVESVETSFRESGGYTIILVNGEDHLFSAHLACITCRISREALEPRSFSFNSPYGACLSCDGLGASLEVSRNLIVPDESLSLKEGAVAPWTGTVADGHFNSLLAAALAYHGGSMTTPFSNLPHDAREAIFDGDKNILLRVTYDAWGGSSRPYQTRLEGVVPWVRRRWKQSSDDNTRWTQYLQQRKCETCKGARLNEEALSVLISNHNISELASMTVDIAHSFFTTLLLTGKSEIIGDPVRKEILARLGFLKEVGLGYLTLDRAATSLSGGEAQRIRLATQIGSGLTGVLYVLDEPSIGLHQRDNRRLLDTLIKLRDLGNTLIVVEHDEETIELADWVVEIGPGAGRNGGNVVYSGTPKGLLEKKSSLTANYMTGRKRIQTPDKRRKGTGSAITVIGASANNLDSIDVNFPLGTLTVVSGVSGSGKSTLVNDILAAGLAKKLNGSYGIVAKHKRIDGLENVDKLVVVDQSPIGRTPRSNPATYTGVFDHVRNLFASTEISRVRGYGPGRFSFNVKGGRCESCAGDGTTRVEMNFLPDVYVPCDTCVGARYNRETLEITYKQKSIADVLSMTVDEGAIFFDAIPTIKRHLTTLVDVGLGYITLGQSATTLSGGEAQRIKITSELHKRSTGKTVYILDEPTTGLHFDDVAKLVKVLQKLVSSGNTVIVIEHNLDIIRIADWVIDLGPEGGPGGGLIVAEGTPEHISTILASHTGRFLHESLKRDKSTS